MIFDLLVAFVLGAACLLLLVRQGRDRNEVEDAASLLMAEGALNDAQGAEIDALREEVLVLLRRVETLSKEGS